MKKIKLYFVPIFATSALLFLFIRDFAPGPCPAGASEDSLCADIEKRYDAVLSAASGVCRINGDCGCYGPVSRKSGCGGVTDEISAGRLRKIGQEFRKAGCEWHIRCAPWFCNPVCERGRCVRGK